MYMYISWYPIKLIFFCSYLFLDANPEDVKKDHHYYQLTPQKQQVNKEDAPTEQIVKPASDHEPDPVPEHDHEVAANEECSGHKTKSDESYKSSSGYSDRSSDDDYEPLSSSSSSSSDDDVSETPTCPTHEDLAINYVTARKYIVFEEQLYELLKRSRCDTCGKVLNLLDDFDEHITFKGSSLKFSATCLGHPSHVSSWSSQPSVGYNKNAMPAGNLLIPAAILFSGSNYAKVSHFASLLNLGFVSRSTFDSHQRNFLFGTVHDTWERERQQVLQEIKETGGKVRLSGDGRCDSPGYSASYCTYSVMDMSTNKIVDTETVAVKEVSSSNAMEKEGCKRVLNRVQQDVVIEIFCTDRHMSIQKMMREEYPTITHQFDVWHLTKSVTNKLLSKAKKKDAEELMPWIPALKNHLWWSAATCNGNETELIEKWQSASHHVTNQHDWGFGQIVTRCEHGELSIDDTEEVKWIEPESTAHVELNKVLTDKRLIEGVKKLNNFCHTGELETFNGFMLKYCPKRNYFGHEGMVARTQLAALDHNANVGREQAVISQESETSGELGAKRFRLVYSKAGRKWVVKRLYKEKNYDFLNDMMVEVLVRKYTGKIGSDYEPPAARETIAPVSVPKPSKSEAIAAHTSRFGHE